MVVSPTQWPHGIAWLASTLHAERLRARRLHRRRLDRLRRQGRRLRALPAGHQHVRVVGRRRVKVDWCGGAAAGLDPATQYAQIHQAILNNASHRPMLLNICNFLQPGQGPRRARAFNQSAFISYSFGPSDGNSWRTEHRRRGRPATCRSAACCATSTPTRRSRRPPAPATGTIPTTSAPDQGMRAEPVPDAVQHVGDARRAVDDQRRHADDEQHEPRDGLQPPGDRDRPGPGRRPGRSCRTRRSATARSGSSRCPTAASPSRC